MNYKKWNETEKGCESETQIENTSVNESKNKIGNESESGIEFENKSGNESESGNDSKNKSFFFSSNKVGRRVKVEMKIKVLIKVKI